MNEPATHAVSAARAAYYQRIDAHALAPLWEVLRRVLTPYPRTRAAPHLWSYAALRPYLIESAELISAAEAERRVLVLENPAMRGETALTETLYAGLQIIMPGEVAPAHRHTPSALRFIVEGEGAYTAVDGERACMAPGDLVLTPSWVWHDHGHDGTQPVVWLDGLDIPLMRHLSPVFFEDYSATTFPPGRPPGDTQARWGAGLAPFGEPWPAPHSPLFHYPYARTRAALAGLASGTPADPCHGYKMEYVNPADGGPVMPTLSCFLQLLPAGFHGAPYRSTAAWAYCVVEGSGRTVVGDQVFEWGPHDVFIVPCWHAHHHEAGSASVLFSYSDKGLQGKLGLYREQRGEAVR